jgi:hypothetical protein
MGVIERIGNLAGTEAAKAVNLAHETFQTRVGEHGHTGRALVETLAEVARNHPNIVGIGVGLLVEQLLVHEKHVHDARAHDAEVSAAHPPAQSGKASRRHPDEHPHPALRGMRISRVKPGKIAFEVFGALVALKIAAAFAHVFRRRSHKEAWFSPAAKIHSISGAIAAYYVARTIKSNDISSLRNAAVFFWGTHAIKPMLKLDKEHRAAMAAAAAERRVAARVTAAAPSAPAPAVEHHAPPPPAEHHPAPDHHAENHAPPSAMGLAPAH